VLSKLILAEEQFYVLKRGTVINGLSFPMWEEKTQSETSTSTVYRSEHIIFYTSKRLNLLLSDPDGQPKLSPEQEKVSPLWRRAQYAPEYSFLLHFQLLIRINYLVRLTQLRLQYKIDVSFRRIFYSTLSPTAQCALPFRSV